MTGSMMTWGNPNVVSSPACRPSPRRFPVVEKMYVQTAQTVELYGDKSQTGSYYANLRHWLAPTKMAYYYRDPILVMASIHHVRNI